MLDCFRVENPQNVDNNINKIIKIVIIIIIIIIMIVVSTIIIYLINSFSWTVSDVETYNCESCTRISLTPANVLNASRMP